MIEVKGGNSLGFILQFLQKHKGSVLMAAAFLELQILACLLTGALLLKGGLW
jgi:hypothetical protein